MATSGRIWGDLVISSVGTHPSLPQAQIKALITNTTAKFQAAVGSNCTHLVATAESVDNFASKYMKAITLPECKVVSLKWLLDSCAQGAPLNEEDYLLGTSQKWARVDGDTNDENDNPTAQSASVQAAPASDAPLSARMARVSTRIATAAVKAEQAVTSESVVAAETLEEKGRKRPMKQQDPEDSEDEAQETKKQKNSQKATSKTLNIPVDPTFFSAVRAIQSPKVYVDSDGLIWDAALNQTSATKNNNKFYCVQLLFEESTDLYYAFTHWGRVGEVGSSALLGDGDLKSATALFERKFKDKSGLQWQSRLDTPKNGKYAFIERDYEDDEEKDGKVEKVEKGVKEEIKDEPTEMPSLLAHPIQNLMDFVFNQDHFQSALASMNYDAQKLPLGKLSQRTLLSGFSVLKELSELIDSPELAASDYGADYKSVTEQLSNRFFTIIPHVFGRNRPPVLASHAQIKVEIEVLENLTDMELSNEIMKDSKKSGINHRDRQFQSLGMEEMTPLEHNSKEFIELENYLTGSRGTSHNLQYQVLEIFRIERKGEEERFQASPYANVESSDRRLLWHGSRSTNFGGILSQGLRIAPPEAPVNGYMFGKGVYLADASSKSANYCNPYQSGNKGLLLLCEAELGTPMFELYSADYNAGENAKAEEKIATLGKGRFIPGNWKDAKCINRSLRGVKIPDVDTPVGEDSQAGLWYNEYIIYDVAQIRQRYLFYVKM
ncbi:hypothetical protein N7495_004738 [Penicillium taxi]|uniref:uncharacterized protein n=1 Tax=Penicillium taxi TaxID=168475 RepID=UPI00254522F7|nr:uncharacterized protein N7495_004738 [Penicillium taxi]KAJ5899994.1 hypothetical protein N7495_004738 [Penicillium taxi]